MYGAISCRLGILSSLSLQHLGMKSTSNNNKITTDKTVPIDIQTIFLVFEVSLVFLEFESLVADGPSAGLLGASFPGVCLSGVWPEDGTLKKGGAGGSAVGIVGEPVGDVGGALGATLVLNGFPFDLQKL